MRRLSYAVAMVNVIPLCCLFPVAAKADGDAISAYVTDHGGEACEFMREAPDLAGVKHAVDHIAATSGLPEDQTGKLLGSAVTADCPEYADLVREFVWYVKRRQQNSMPTGAGS